MARRRHRKSNRADSAINITPLGDVSLSLLLGFLVITPIIIETMATTLPQEGSGVSAGAVRQDPIVVLTAEGQILLNGREVTEQELPAELTIRRGTGPAGKRLLDDSWGEPLYFSEQSDPQ